MLLWLEGVSSRGRGTGEVLRTVPTSQQKLSWQQLVIIWVDGQSAAGLLAVPVLPVPEA